MQTIHNHLITINNCHIENEKRTLINDISWTMRSGEAWLVIGPNGSGKSTFLSALAEKLSVVPNEVSGKTAQDPLPLYSSVFGDSVEIVSLERAAALIQEERDNDESEYTEGGVDIGRTGRIFIAEPLTGPYKKGKPLPETVKRIEAYPAIKLCGVEKILDRGIKYMSTGEIRRTLLARALISGKKLLILSDPFAGLDVDSRAILLDFFSTITGKQLTENGTDSAYPHIILGMERYYEIPDAITNVLEFRGNRISFCGTRREYEQIISRREAVSAKTRGSDRAAFAERITGLQKETEIIINNSSDESASEKEADGVPEKLIEMHGVNVGWDDRKVLVDLTWTLHKGEHWLIRGPNGSGKTTFLELITGDNMQVYCNDVRMFGRKRGTGETMWEIKAKLGIVSYRLHVEYRMVGGTNLRSVIISGFRDSIGLYEQATDIETAAADKWLALGGFSGRETESFGDLSYGEQRAILILRAAVKCPPVLILDEPCHGLDESYRQKILDLLETVAASGTTTLLHVTHESDEVLPCEKHILELHPGKTPMYEILTI
ncbi:MAG TPA: ABC transporter [Treponema sp.]|nr:ABC transporter [Treponema sp.]